MRNLKAFLFGAGMAAILLSSCGNNGMTLSGLDPARFDTTIDEKPVKLYTLTNKNGMEVCITNFGGRIVSVMVPDKNGSFVDVVLGYDNIAQYADSANSPSDYGATIGRYANRINKGQMVINNEKIQLPTNNFGHCLHGGPSGWQYQVYDAEQIDKQTLKLTIVSPDGDNGFPGTVTATATYKVTDDNAIDCTYEATTDKETVINMCNHSYFTLTGDPSQPGTNMVLRVNADNFTPTDATYMTTGEIKPVYGSSMDFNKGRALYEVIADTTEQQIKNAGGFDHNYCLNTYKDGTGNDKMVAASLYAENTGIFLEVFTNEPGIQVYTGNFQGTGIACKHGIKYPKHVSVCLETQKYPDTPNKKDWPTANLKPGEKYLSHVAYKFSVK
jgi:aldose 1-epimerase